MLNQVVTSFILKSEEIMDSNEEITMWCWRISAGDRRSRKKVVHSSQDWNSDTQDLVDEIWEALNKLEGEPVDNAWVELLAKGQSRIFHYEHVEVSEPTEQPQIITPDGKRMPIAENYGAAVMSTQLVKTNDQLLNLSMGLARMNAALTQKQMDTAIAYTELETEARVRTEFDTQNSMSEALSVFGPMMNTFLAQYLAQNAAKKNAQEATIPADATECHQEPDPGERMTEEQVDHLVNDFEWVCKHRPEYLTEDRVNRVVSAFTAGP